MYSWTFILHFDGAFFWKGWPKLFSLPICNYLELHFNITILNATIVLFYFLFDFTDLILVSVRGSILNNPFNPHKYAFWPNKTPKINGMQSWREIKQSVRWRWWWWCCGGLQSTNWWVLSLLPWWAGVVRRGAMRYGGACCWLSVIHVTL